MHYPHYDSANISNKVPGNYINSISHSTNYFDSLERNESNYPDTYMKSRKITPGTIIGNRTKSVCMHRKRLNNLSKERNRATEFTLSPEKEYLERKNADSSSITYQSQNCTHKKLYAQPIEDFEKQCHSEEISIMNLNESIKIREELQDKLNQRLKPIIESNINIGFNDPEDLGLKLAKENKEIRQQLNEVILEYKVLKTVFL